MFGTNKRNSSSQSINKSTKTWIVILLSFNGKRLAVGAIKKLPYSPPPHAGTLSCNNNPDKKKEVLVNE